MSKKLKKSSVMTDPLPESELMKNIDKEVESMENVEKINIQRNCFVSNILYDCSIAVLIISSVLLAVLKNGESKIITAFVTFIGLGGLYFFFKMFAERNRLNKIRKILFRTFIVLSALLAMVTLALN